MSVQVSLLPLCLSLVHLPSLYFALIFSHHRNCRCSSPHTHLHLHHGFSIHDLDLILLLVFLVSLLLGLWLAVAPVQFIWRGAGVAVSVNDRRRCLTSRCARNWVDDTLGTVGDMFYAWILFHMSSLLSIIVVSMVLLFHHDGSLLGASNNDFVVVAIASALLDGLLAREEPLLDGLAVSSTVALRSVASMVTHAPAHLRQPWGRRRASGGAALHGVGARPLADKH